MANNNNVVISITGVNNTGPAFAGVRSSAQSAVSSIEKSFSTIGNSFKSVGKSMTTAITLPVAGIVGSSVKTAMSFEQQMSKVSAISGAAGEDLQDLTAKAKEMGAKTKFSATESAQAFEYMAMAGWKTEEMMNGIEGVMNLAAASGEDLATVSDIVTDAMTAFGMKASESGRFADILASASSNSNTNVAMLGESFKYVAPVMGALGMSAEDTAVALGLMANAGIKSSMAGTSLRTAITNLSEPTAQMQKAMKKLNISMTDSKGQTKDLKTIMKDLRSSFANLTETEQVNYATAIFGKNAYAGMLAIINSSEQDFNKLTSAVYSSSDGIGTASKMSETMMDNLSGQITILKSAWEGIQLKIADSVLPTIKKFVEWAQKVADKINAMKPETLDMIVKFSLIAAAIGPVVWMFGSFITSVLAIVKGVSAFAGAIKMLSTTFTLLKIAMAGASATPWGLIITAIGIAVVGLGAIIYKNWDKIKSCLSTAFNWVKEKVNALINWLKPSVKGLAQKLGIEEELNVVGKTIKDFKWYDWFAPIGQIKIFDGLLKHFNDGNGIVEIAKSIGQKIADAWNGMTDVLSGWYDSVVEWLNSVKEGITSWFNGVIDFAKEKINQLKETFNKIADFIKTSFNTIVNAIKDVFETVVKIASNFIKPIIEVIKTTLNKIKLLFLGIFAIIYTQIKKRILLIVKVVQLIIAPIKKVIDSIMNIVKKMQNKIARTIAKIVDSITKTFKKIVQTFKNIVGKIVSQAKTIISNVKNLFSKGMTFIVGKITTIFGKIRSVYNSLQTFYLKIMDFIRSILDVVNSFKKGFQSAMEKVVDVFQSIYNHFLDFMDKFKSFTSDVKSNFVSFVNAIITGINHLIAGINKLHITTPAVPELNIPAIDLGFNIPEIPTLPELNIGASQVLRDGLAIIHKGEAVVPAEVNPFTAKNKDLIVKNKSNVITVKVVVEDNREDAIVPVNIDGRKVADLLMKHTRNAVAVRGC